jgi:hypothetical protein
MTTATRKRKQVGELRKQFAQNLARLMDQRYKESTNRPKALAKDTGFSLSSIQRTLDCETGATVDTIERYGEVFGLPPFQLLVPWGLLGDLTAERSDIVRSTTVLRGRGRVLPDVRSDTMRRRRTG